LLLIATLLTASCASSNLGGATNANVVAPAVVQRVYPEYPVDLRQQHVSGTVVVGGTVPKEGGVLRNPHVVRSDDPRLNQLALDAVSRWIWKAGLIGGEPTDVEFTTEVYFGLRP
jgi:TonB family protein